MSDAQQKLCPEKKGNKRLGFGKGHDAWQKWAKTHFLPDGGINGELPLVQNKKHQLKNKS